MLDLHLPDVPGAETPQGMRAASWLEAVPVIVVTAHTELAEKVEDEVELPLIKPVRYDELQEGSRCRTARPSWPARDGGRIGE